mgnify:CR=1 FL=1
MAAIITSKFRIHNAESFVEGFSEAAATNIYLGIGRPEAWTNDNSPDTPKDTVAEEYYYWEDMLALKRIQSSDVSHAVPRRNWTSGKYYDAYRHDYNGTGQPTEDNFFGVLGCNGTVELRFTTPIYLWLLEHM